jgi:hypothetical protein
VISMPSETMNQNRRACLGALEGVPVSGFTYATMLGFKRVMVYYILEIT